MKSLWRRPVFGSRRPRFHKQKPVQKNVVKRRDQRVRFRRRYATSVLKNSGLRLWRLMQIFIVAILIGLGGKAFVSWWNTTTFNQISQITYSGDIPNGLAEILSLDEEQNFFLFSPAARENEALRQFPQLESLKIKRRITRTLAREVRIMGEYRVLLGHIRVKGRMYGFDKNGVIFPIEDRLLVDGGHYPVVVTHHSEPNIKPIARVLESWRAKKPEFFSQVIEISVEPDIELLIKLQNGAEVIWPLTEELLDRVDHILRVLARFEPVKAPATLRFVTDQRIVMNSNWAPHQNKENYLGKTRDRRRH